MAGTAEAERDPVDASPPITLRPHRAGDMAIIEARHRELYGGGEYGWDGQRMGELVRRVAADFVARDDPARERCWIAEREGRFVGSVMLARDGAVEGTANLRLLLVDREARGSGLGRRLVARCAEFAREAGYRRITLWTNSELTSAIRLYQSEGYRLVREEEHETFGRRMTGQYWELDLSDVAAR